MDWAHGRVSRFKGRGVSWDELLSYGYDVVKVDCEGCEWMRREHVERAPLWVIEVVGPLSSFLKRIPSEYKIAILYKGLDSGSLQLAYLILAWDPRRIPRPQRTLQA